MNFLTVAVAMLAFAGLGSCSKDDDKKSNSTPAPAPAPEVVYTESNTFAIKYEGASVAAGDTVTYVYSGAAIPVVNFAVVNKTSEPKNAFFKVEKLEGPAVMNEMGFCTDVCDDFACPFVAPSERNFTVPAGEEAHFHMQFLLDEGTGTALYRMSAGSGHEVQDPQVIFVKVTI